MSALFQITPGIHCNVVPDGNGGRSMRGPQGQLLFPGLLTVPEWDWKIMDGRPVRVFKLHAKVWIKGELVEWDFELTDNQFDHLEKHLQDHMPEGIKLEITDPLMLRKGILALTSNDSELCYISDTLYWTDKDGLRLEGRLICKPAVHITGERQNEQNETIYRLRSGDRYFDVTFADLQTEKWTTCMGEKGRIFDPLSVFVTLRDEWNKLTPDQKQRLRNEELEAKARAHQQEMQAKERSARWRIQ